MASVVVYGISITDEQTGKRTKSVMNLGLAIVVFVVINVILSLASSSMQSGTSDIVLKCAAEEKMDLPAYGWNATRHGQVAADKVIKCYSDQMGGVFGYIQPFIGLVLTLMVPAFAFFGAKNKNRSLICTACVMSFICAVLAIAGIGFFILAVLVSTKAVKFPERGSGQRTGPCAPYPINTDFRICMGRETGASNIGLGSGIVGFILLILWWFLAICSCRLYNDPYFQNVTVIQTNVAPVATVEIPAQAPVVQATVVTASVVASGPNDTSSGGAVVKATVVG